MLKVLVYLWCTALLSGGYCRPPQKHRDSFSDTNNINEDAKNTANDGYSLDQLGIEYNRYLQQVIDALEHDEVFKKKLESAQEHDIKSAKIAEELEYVNHHVRSKLDELKRTELQRLRELARQAYGHENEIHSSPPGHLDHENPNTFEIKDLKKLIHKVAEDLENADKKRKEMFKTYEMEKHFEREQKLQNMTEEDRKKFLQHEKEIKKREQEGKKRVHHPGSKQQLEEVWEEQDHMNKNDFNPKTFFAMHDVDGNGFLDEDEIKSLFLKELDKLYSEGTFQGDLMERAEEMERMREHVFQEVDKNRDRLISWDEFYAMSLQPDFNEDPGWQPLDDQQIYSPDELRAYEHQRLQELEMLKREGKIPSHPAQYADHTNNTYYQYNIDPNVHYNPEGHPQQYYQQPVIHQSVPQQQTGLHPPQAAVPQQQVNYGGVPQQQPQLASYGDVPQHQPQQVNYAGVPQPPQQVNYAGVPPQQPQQANYAGVPQQQPQQANYAAVPQHQPQQANYAAVPQQHPPQANHAAVSQQQPQQANYAAVPPQSVNSNQQQLQGAGVHQQFETVNQQNNEQKKAGEGTVHRLN